MPASLSELEQRRAALLQHISELGDLRPGSITGTGGRCGNRGCHCHRPNDAGHSPHPRLTYKVAGKTATGELCHAGNSPGRCSCAKNTSRVGPSVARQYLIRRRSVRTCPSRNRSGYVLCKCSNSVLACKSGSAISNCRISSHVSANGSGRVRHVCFCCI